MLAAERRRVIVELVRSQRSVTIAELAERLGISGETVRRDLDRLDSEGQIRKVRGGAVRHTHSVHSEPSFLDRQRIAADEKRGIAQAALELVAGTRTVFLDLGTTAIAVARELVPGFQGTVVTPSMRVAEVLAESRDITVLVPGGIVRGGDMSISGPPARAFLADVYPDVAFIGTGGVDLEAGITDFEIIEVETKRLVIANSDRSYALADSSKFGARAPYRVCDASGVDGILTDDQLSEADYAEFQSNDIALIVGRT